MRRAVVHDPEHPACRVVLPLTHKLNDQPLERRDSGSRFAAAKQIGAMYVQGVKESPRAAAMVLVLHAHRLADSGSQAGTDGQASQIDIERSSTTYSIFVTALFHSPRKGRQCSFVRVSKKSDIEGSAAQDHEIARNRRDDLLQRER